jgi:hypothetical protein
MGCFAGESKAAFSKFGDSSEIFAPAEALAGAP